MKRIKQKKHQQDLDDAFIKEAQTPEQRWLEAFHKLTDEQKELLLQIADQLKVNPADHTTDGV